MRTATSGQRLVLALIGALSLLVAAAGGVLAATSRPDHSLTVGPLGQSVQQGQVARYAVTVTGTGGATGEVALTASGLPPGTTASFSPASATLTSRASSATSTLTITTTARTPAATSSVVVTGTSGSRKRSVTVGLTVNPARTSAFALSASPSSVSLAPGATAVYSLAVTRPPGSGGTTALAAHGTWPAGTSATFSSTTLSGTATTSTLQVATTAGTTPDGSHALYVVAQSRDASTGQTSTQYAQVQLVVDSRSAGRAFSISGGQPARPLAPGAPGQPLDLALTNPHHQPLPLTNLTVTVRATSAGSACTPADFEVVQYSGPYPLSLPGGATGTTLSALGVPAAQQPQLRMLDLPRNQDGCRDAQLSLAYSGSASGR